VPPKWLRTGRLCATTLTGLSRAQLPPCLGSLVAVPCARACHLAAACPSQRHVCPFMMALPVCARPLVAVHRALTCAGCLWGTSGLHLPFRGSALGGSSCVHLPSCSSVSTSSPCLALSRAQGTSALDLTAVAFSALPVGSKPAVPSARAGAVPMTSSASPCLCALTPFRADVHGAPSQRQRPLPADLNVRGCQVAKGVLRPHGLKICNSLRLARP
jgi:hypothetical protein